MLRIVITDGSSVQIGSATITGPVTFDADSLHVGSVSVETGCYVLTDGVLTKTAQVVPGVGELLWSCMIFAFILGVGRFSIR
jgi:hypothetical protein